MKTFLLFALFLAGSLAANAQQSQATANGTTARSGDPKTSSVTGLKRKGVGSESPKMKKGISRSGDSNLSPTSPTNDVNSQVGTVKPKKNPATASSARSTTGTTERTSATGKSTTQGGTTGPGKVNAPQKKNG